MADCPKCGREHLTPTGHEACGGHQKQARGGGPCRSAGAGTDHHALGRQRPTPEAPDMTQTSEVRVSLADVPEMLSVLRAATAMHDAIFYLDGEFLANAPTQVVLAYSDLQAALRNLSLGHRAEPIRADADTEL